MKLFHLINDILFDFYCYYVVLCSFQYEKNLTERLRDKTGEQTNLKVTGFINQFTTYCGISVKNQICGSAGVL